MLADQPARVGAVGSGFAAKARGVGDVLQRQRVAVQDFSTMQVRERHLSGRNQKQIPLTRHLEQIGFELRQLPGAFE